MSTYKIIRFFSNINMHREEIGEGGLTLEEAQEHCKSPETASDTCTTQDGIDRTNKHGTWLDGYEEE
jgi:hypothetical protein